MSTLYSEDKTSSGLTAAEQRRLRQFHRPTQVSLEVLGTSRTSLRGKSVLDLGCGSNMALCTHVQAQGATYYGLDRNIAFLKTQQEVGVQTVCCGDVTTLLPFGDKSIDIVHMRLVLMHLTPRTRMRAVREAVRIARERVVFIEPDWEVVDGGIPAVTAFKDMVVNVFMPHMGIHPYMGRDLLSLTCTSVTEFERCQWNSVHAKRFSTPPGNYYDSFTSAVETMYLSLDEKERFRLAKIGLDLKAESVKEHPTPFMQPDFISVEIRKVA